MEHYVCSRRGWAKESEERGEWEKEKKKKKETQPAAPTIYHDEEEDIRLTWTSVCILHMQEDLKAGFDFG